MINLLIRGSDNFKLSKMTIKKMTTGSWVIVAVASVFTVCLTSGFFYFYKKVNQKKIETISTMTTSQTHSLNNSPLSINQETKKSNNSSFYKNSNLYKEERWNNEEEAIPNMYDTNKSGYEYPVNKMPDLSIIQKEESIKNQPLEHQSISAFAVETPVDQEVKSLNASAQKKVDPVEPNLNYTPEQITPRDAFKDMRPSATKQEILPISPTKKLKTIEKDEPDASNNSILISSDDSLSVPSIDRIKTTTNQNTKNTKDVVWQKKIKTPSYLEDEKDLNNQNVSEGQIIQLEETIKSMAEKSIDSIEQLSQDLQQAANDIPQPLLNPPKTNVVIAEAPNDEAHDPLNNLDLSYLDQATTQYGHQAHALPVHFQPAKNIANKTLSSDEENNLIFKLD